MIKNEEPFPGKHLQLCPTSLNVCFCKGNAAVCNRTVEGSSDTQPVPGVPGAPPSLHGTETSHVAWMRTDKNTRPRSVLSKEPLSGFPRSSDRLPKKMLTIPTPEILLKENLWKEGKKGRKKEKEREKEKNVYTKTHQLERRGFPFRKTNFWKPIQKKRTIRSQMRFLSMCPELISNSVNPKKEKQGGELADNEKCIWPSPCPTPNGTKKSNKVAHWVKINFILNTFHFHNMQCY